MALGPELREVRQVEAPSDDVVGDLAQREVLVACV
jgi:hypothetical protein